MFLRTALICAAMTGALQELSAAPAPTILSAQEATLRVGDKAPALTVEKWVKGAPVAGFEKGKVYMVEFWATWCPPCISSMPHITELQKKHGPKGLTVIGMTSADKNNSLESVEKMVADKGDVMGYTVAWDKERTTNEAFMKAAKQGGIPCSFLIDQNGVIVYIGHPMSIDATLDLVMEGKHDVKKLVADAKVAAEREAKAEAIDAKIRVAWEAEEWDTVFKGFDELYALDSKQYAGTQVTKFMILADQIKDLDRAYALGNELLTGALKDDARLLDVMASWIVDPETEVARRDADLALKMATRAVELSKEKDARMLDTLARAHFVKGDVAKAIATQEKAVAIDKRLEPSLKEYKEAASKKG